MQVLTKEEVAVTQISDVVNSNFDTSNNNRTAIERLNNGIKNSPTKVDIYEEYPKPYILSEDEKRNILNTTFKLGNLAVFDESKANIKPDFKHSYTLRFIVIDPKLTTTKETVKNYASQINSFSVCVSIK